MPANVHLSEEYKLNILKGQGLGKNTIDKRVRVFSHFCDYIKTGQGITGDFDIKLAVLDKSLTRENIFQYYKE